MEDRWQTSRELLARARKSLAGGVSSPFRANFPVPLYFRDGCGARLEDADGNRYIDYTLAWGPLILGHKHPALVEALRRAAERPHLLGAQHDLEYQVAEMVQRLVPCAGRVAFTSSGSEAVQLALRLARAFTGRNLVVKFEGHYHGWMDSALISYHPSAEQIGPPEAPVRVLGSRGQTPNAAENLVVARWNDIESLERALFGVSAAAIIMEPVLCNSGCLMPRPGYLQAVREIATRHGALLIFDEIITGFRIALGGAQEHFGVTPDLATFGKALGGGLPLSAVAGRADILELMFGGGAVFGGTFNGNPVSLAAAHATLTELAKGEALPRANAAGEALMAGIRRLGGVQVNGFGAAFSLKITDQTQFAEYRDLLRIDDEPGRAVVRRALEQGIYLLPDGRMYVSAAHGETEVAETLAALERALRS